MNEFSRSYDTKGLDIVVWGGRRELWRNDGRLLGESVAGESAGGKNADGQKIKHNFEIMMPIILKL